MESIVLWILAVVLAAGYYVISRTRKQVVLPPPGNRGYPVVGETFSLFTTEPDKFVRDHRKEYGDIFSSYLMNNPTIVVSTVDANKFFLEEDGSKYCIASKLKSMRNTLGPDQVNQANDDLHRRFYKLILSHMLPEVLKAKVRIIDEAARNVLDSLSTGAAVVMKPELEKFTFLTIASLVCDQLVLDANDLVTQGVLNAIRTLTDGIVSLPINIPFLSYFRALQARKRMVSFFKKIVRQRRSDNTPHDDLLQTLSTSEENGRRLSLEEVADNAIACLFAGHHTSALTLVWIMKFLQESPEILDDLKEEHSRIAQSKEAEDYFLTWEDCHDMRLTWMVIQEALRLSNVPPAVIREIKHPIVYQGFMFPKGWNLILNFSANHMNENNFREPKTFNPYRFMVPPKRGTYTPFGAGNRTCAGRELAKLEMLVFIHRLVRQYRWIPAASTRIRVNYRMLPTIQDGYPVNLQWIGNHK